MSARYRETNTVRPNARRTPFLPDPHLLQKDVCLIPGQQSEMKIDDTWPQKGEMRIFWNSTTEIWTKDLSKDDTWQPNEHTSQQHFFFAFYLTRNAVAMFPLILNLVASTEHECRGPICPLCHTPRRKGDAWFCGCQNYPTCTIPTTWTPPVPLNLEMLLLKQQTPSCVKGYQRRDVVT